MSNANTLCKMGGLTVLATCGMGLMMTGLVAAATPPAGAASSAAPAATSVVVGAFEGEATQNNRFGALVLNHGKGMGWGWASTDDQRAGGNSTASVALAHPGANDTDGALKVTGELKSGFISPWAGAVWFPGARPMQPADLSGQSELVFWAKGQPGSYSVMVMSGSARSIPKYASFTLTDQWKKYTIPLATSFVGADWKHVYFVAFSAGAFGKFHFQLDGVTLH